MTKTITRSTPLLKPLSTLVVLERHQQQMKAFNQLIQSEKRMAIKHLTDTDFHKYLAKLLNTSDIAELPYAVVAPYELLAENNFQIARTMRTHQLFKYIPLIAVALATDKIDRQNTIKAGIDDCYQEPVDWVAVRSRIDFLAQFKAEISESIGNPDELPEFKIPLGKRVFDILVASIVIFILSPLLLLVALAIKLESKGAIIYKSKRAGMGYHVFDFLKFRSMYADADQRLKQLQHLNQYEEQEDGKPQFFKIANDPRITKVGRLIRKTSIDELPQLFNVLMGDMSIVGNRPLPLYEAEQLTKDDWTSRFLAPAGLTGLWQVTKRGKSDMSVEERISLDVEYAETFSVARDFQIMVKTPFALIQKENV